MNQNNSMTNFKMGGRDFINLGIFTVMFIVLFMACIMVMSMTVYTLPFGVALASIITAPVYLLLRVKTPKTGAITLFGTLFGLVLFGMGSGWPILAAVVASALIAEIVAKTGKYQSYKHESLGFVVLMLGTALGSYIPFLMMKDYYMEVAQGNNIDNSFMGQLMSFINAPYLIVAFVATVVTALVGVSLARSIFKKHFVKAGLIKELK